MDSSTAKETAVELLRSVRIPEPDKRFGTYPHQMSGGMRQRVVIAVALACGPKLLFADEPTTALDVTVQAQVLDLLAEQQRERYMAMILVTHDLGVVAGRAHDIAVMYAGRIVETRSDRTLFADMKMPYTEALLSAIPKLDRSAAHPSRGHRWPPTGPREPAGRAARSPHVAPMPGSAAAPSARAAAGRRRSDTPVRLPLPGRLPRDARDQGPHALAANTAWPPPRPPEDARWPVADPSHLRDPDSDALLRVENLVVEFPAGRGRKVSAVSNVSFDLHAGRDPRPRRRVGLRQVHHRQGDHAAAGTDQGHGSARRHRTDGAEGCGTCARPARGCR